MCRLAWPRQTARTVCWRCRREAKSRSCRNAVDGFTPCCLTNCAAGFPRAARRLFAFSRAAFAAIADCRYRNSMNAEMEIGINRKAFQINLDAKKYGTFAEIGAG